ncbi:hypothetical protein BofuT4_uP162570.1 [Botrytis cinerea T4]|uniref:DedA family protein n=1 Tax=Botryotinia fuckeliana (strain T4) TaxID=999810 RepID=G2YT64_BOTF4|nr:hypothetical protein BofuT4_uP162570.1 [Botrytis cinerea T4]
MSVWKIRGFLWPVSALRALTMPGRLNPFMDIGYVLFGATLPSTLIP